MNPIRFSSFLYVLLLFAVAACQSQTRIVSTTTPLPVPTAASLPTMTISPTQVPTVQTTATQAPVALIGKWQTSLKVEESSYAGLYSLEFKPDNVVEIVQPSMTILRGTYQVMNDEITLNADFVAGSNCPTPLVMTLQWSVAANQLGFKLLSDPHCIGLKELFTLHPFKKVP